MPRHGLFEALSVVHSFILRFRGAESNLFFIIEKGQKQSPYSLNGNGSFSYGVGKKLING